MLLVIEVKSELGSIEGTLRPLNVKVRLAREVARTSGTDKECRERRRGRQVMAAAR
jgi:hypothetical protein